MTLRQKITFGIGVVFAGLALLVCFWGNLLLQITGGLIALDGLVLLRLWYRCPSCNRRLNWSESWTYCPHCGARIEYDKTK